MMLWFLLDLRKAEAVENQTLTKRKKTEKAKAIDEDIDDD